MNTRRPLTLALLLAVFCALVSPTVASAESNTPSAAEQKLRESLLVPGVSLAEGISEVTGVAISPLLGMSAMGAWTYYQTPATMRHRLPWYCHPWIWGTGLSLLGVCFLKDFLGAAAPALVKKPLDFAELFEDKLSALVATVGFVPLVGMAISQAERWKTEGTAATQALFGSAGDLPLATAPIPAPVLGALDFAAHTPWVTIPVAMVGFVIVWLTSHAINVLIALSPFGMVDAGLKLTKLALLTLVAGSTALHPYAGAAVSLVLIAIAFILAGWSFRLTLFGTLMGADFLLNKRASPEDIEESVNGFLARRIDGVPVRTRAVLKQDAAGRTVLAYRPWLILPERHLHLPQESLVVRRGLLHPAVTQREKGSTTARNTLILLPRYRRLEEAIASRYGSQEVVDGTLLRGLKAVRQWLVGALSGGRKLIEA